MHTVSNDLNEAIECAQIELYFAAAELRANGLVDEQAALRHMEQAANELIFAIRSWRERHAGRPAWAQDVQKGLE
ncbi:hypothetical protein M2323_001919 [Rhodoblastus acidophilus]|uniref:hypothetical protein n=1 Tax=Rhodoblastus acidophilus TaxID=1074 RepID=UPI00222592F8|nr:hypothetical protein [Rhodoblastus acidophilus]MCW2284152.1 hypothetical protein [Rhodoblastus acidophilus]MCW2332997.1 hypothetical protein [Rhodoblastus acidophilus]